MNFIRDFASKMTSEEMQEHALNVAGVTALASVCAYGGTFFFTSHNPVSGALYLGIVSPDQPCRLSDLREYERFCGCTQAQICADSCPIASNPHGLLLFFRSFLLSADRSIQV